MSLSSESLERVQMLRDHENRYTPNDEVKKYIGTRILKLIAAPSSIGKTEVMRLASKIDESHGRATTLTTREDRPQDEPGLYRTLKYTDDTIDGLSQKVLGGQLVNYKFHPTTGMFYGSETQDYPHEQNLMAALSGSIHQFQNVGFEQTYVFGLVAPPSDWYNRFDKRYPTWHQERRKRINEAEISYTDLLLRSDVRWVINYEGLPELAAKQIVNPETTPADDQANAQALVHRVLHKIEDEKRRAYGEKYE